MTNPTPSSADVIEGMREALREAISFQNEECGHYIDEDGNEQCPDGRCRDHGCMFLRTMRWQAALALPDSKPDKGGA